jgi:hypothetical protein
MTIDGWILFWKITFGVALTAYFGVALLAGVLGGFDLRRLLRGETHAEDDEPVAQASD